MGGGRIVEGVTVTGITQANGRVTGVETDHGPIRCEYVVNAAGMWGREVGALAGVSVPLQAAEHYYLVTDTVDWAHPDLPVVEDPDRYGYYREEGGGILVGLFEPRAAAWSLDRVPGDVAFASLPPDWDRIGPYLDGAMERFPSLRDAGIRTMFCGPESFTPDVMPQLGEAPELRNFFVPRLNPGILLPRLQRDGADRRRRAARGCRPTGPDPALRDEPALPRDRGGSAPVATRFRPAPPAAQRRWHPRPAGRRRGALGVTG
jgi:hypothetical protein